LTSAPDSNSFAGRLATRLPFFYGWVIIYISFFCVFIMGTISFWGIPVFVGPMHEDTGWAHASIITGLALRMVVGAFGGLVLGHLADRRGWPQRLLLFGLLIDAAALFSLQFVTNAFQFVLMYGVVGGAGNTGMRLVQSTLISKWYVARRGTAVGFSANGGGVSALVMVPITALLIAELGWRDAWAALAVIMLVILLPCVPLAVRSPEDIGLQPDNGLAPRQSASRPRRSAATERSYRLSDVLPTFRFWVLLAGMLIGTYSLQTHTVVMVPYFEEIGFSSAVAATSLSVYGLFSIGMRFAWGMLADRYSVRHAIIVQAVLTGIGAFILLQVAGTTTLFIAMAFQGMMLSGFPPLQILLWPEFFGRMHIGSIVGLTQFFSTIAGAIGPVIAGFVFDQTGTYTTTLWLLVITWLVCAAFMVVIRPPHEPARDPAAEVPFG
jgi:MFS family permease